MWIRLLIFPLVGMLVGWFTNYLAVKMLFHPREPKRLLGITVQGIFPKRQLLIAQKIGKVVANELLSVEDIKDKVQDEESLNKIFGTIEEKMDNFLAEKMKEKFPLMTFLTSKKLKLDIKESMLNEVKKQLPSMIDEYIVQFEARLDIENMIAEKFSQLSSDRLEEVMNEILQKEFKFIEIVGAVIGFLIGLVQFGLNQILA